MFNPFIFSGLEIIPLKLDRLRTVVELTKKTNQPCEQSQTSKDRGGNCQRNVIAANITTKKYRHEKVRNLSRDFGLIDLIYFENRDVLRWGSFILAPLAFSMFGYCALSYNFIAVCVRATSHHNYIWRVVRMFFR